MATDVLIPLADMPEVIKALAIELVAAKTWTEVDHQMATFSPADRALVWQAITPADRQYLHALKSQIVPTPPPFDSAFYVDQLQNCLFWPAVEAVTEGLTKAQKKVVWQACSAQQRARIEELKALWTEFPSI